MKHLPYLLLTLLFLEACQQRTEGKHDGTKEIAYQHIETADYQLYKPTSRPSAVLVLFGGYPENAEDIKREFKILEKAKLHEIAIVFSNYNQKLWFEENELNDLALQLQKIFIDYRLPNDKVYFGGFSSGGTVALRAGDYLTANAALNLTPQGIFIVDSPIDLAELFFSSEKNLKRNFSDISVQESKWLIETLESRFGNPHEDLSNYEANAVFTSKTGNIDNLKALRNTKIRMYTEPDTVWWKEQRMADYEQTNAYLIKELFEKMKTADFTGIEYIPTVNKGYRANGDRHPHSWSIVETNDLIRWMLES